MRSNIEESYPLEPRSTAAVLFTSWAKLHLMSKLIARMFGNIDVDVLPDFSQVEVRKISNQEKGDRLEDLAVRLFSEQEGFVVRQKVRQRSEEIDLVVLNRINDPFWTALQTPLILVECRNKTSKVESKELRDFEIKLMDRAGLSRLGVVISTSGFTDGCKETVARSRRDGHKILLVDNAALKRRAEGNLSTAAWLEELILEQC